MCIDSEVVQTVPIHAHLSHTGEMHWAEKGVDSCIATIVHALNFTGVLTASSCCGHGKTPGTIILHDGRVLVTYPSLDEALEAAEIMLAKWTQFQDIAETIIDNRSNITDTPPE